MGKNPIFKNEFGKVTMELYSIKAPVDEENPERTKDVLEVRGVALGAMPVALWIRPPELMDTLGLLSLSVIGRVTKMVAVGALDRIRSGKKVVEVSKP